MDKTKKREEIIGRLIKKYYKDKGILHRDRLLENEIASNVNSNSKVLDAGCGYDAAIISKYCDVVGEAVGVDLAHEFNVNHKVKTYTANLENLPFRDNYFDLIISRSVCEHLIDPVRVFKELSRVLKHEGRIIISTPNKYYYSSIISALLPFSIARTLLKKILKRDEYDNFPTYYRCNTKRQVVKIASKTGLELERCAIARQWPYYLSFSVGLFKMGILYDMLISALHIDCLQYGFLFILRKK